MLAMVSMRSPCKPEIDHSVILPKKKRKISKFGFVPSRSTAVISEWKDESRSVSAPKKASSNRDDRKRSREFTSWDQPLPKVMGDPAAPATKPLPVTQQVSLDKDSESEAPAKRKSPITSTSTIDNNSNSGSDSDSDSDSDSSDESDTDEEEIMMWAHKMFGCPLRPPPSSPPPSPPRQQQPPPQQQQAKSRSPSPVHIPPAPQPIIPQFHSNADAEARARRKKAKKEKWRTLQGLYDDSTDVATDAAKEVGNDVANDDGVNNNDDDDDDDEERIEAPAHPIARKKKKKVKKQPFVLPPLEECEKFDPKQEEINMEEERKKREMAKPLTMKQIKEILGEDDFREPCQENWVRRSVRRPCKALLNSKPVRGLVRKLKKSHREMVVLKMKKYINDPDAPQVVIDAALDALEENKNCEALFIQNFNEGMRDNQILHLLRILQQPHCKIWCLNIGETYNVDTETWEKFTKGLRWTKVTHMYASEHTITTEMKDEIRATIRENRSKHNLHIDPNNLDVIVQCTHCWWNPMNAKALRPYLKKKGYEHMLTDKEAQGMKGSTSAAPSK